MNAHATKVSCSVLIGIFIGVENVSIYLGIVHNVMTVCCCIDTAITAMVSRRAAAVSRRRLDGKS